MFVCVCMCVCVCVSSSPMVDGIVWVNTWHQTGISIVLLFFPFWSQYYNFSSRLYVCIQDTRKRKKCFTSLSIPKRKADFFSHKISLKFLLIGLQGSLIIWNIFYWFVEGGREEERSINLLFHLSMH